MTRPIPWSEFKEYKFQDCVACTNRNCPDVCAVCDAGEMFEPESDRTELDFSGDGMPPSSDDYGVEFE